MAVEEQRLSDSHKKVVEVVDRRRKMAAVLVCTAAEEGNRAQASCTFPLVHH